MKKIIALLLVFASVFALASCAAEAPSWDFNKDQAFDGVLGDNMTGITGIMENENQQPNGEGNGEDLKENPFVSTEQENVSTFAADVDTASYAFFRRLVNEGYSFNELAASFRYLRTEEMVNYFDYGYAEPAEGELFSTQMQIAPCPWNAESKLLVLGLQAKKLETASKNNLVFLIDVSGSMNTTDKLGLLKKSFSHLTDKLGEDDTISIVTYSGAERVVLEGCNGSKKEKILNAVNSLEANGSTNGEAGLKKAYQIAEKYFIQGGNNRIIMASDGDLNVGISSADDLKAFVSEKKESGVFLSVLGFGTGNYKDANMEAIADCGNGVYYYIDGETEAEKVFGKDIFSTLYTVAKDVKLQLTFNQNAVSAYRLIGYENRLLDKEDFLDDTKDAGELGAGHSLTVCYELVLTEQATNAEEWMTLGVRYKTPDGTKSEGEEYVFGAASYTETPDDNFKFISAVIETSMLLRESEYITSVSLNSVLESLKALSLNDEYKKQFVTLIETLCQRPNSDFSVFKQ